MERTKTLKSVVLWSIISAAFIGPGTVTTAVSAGSQFGLQLLWAVTFATAACIILQEVAARITIASGMNVGQALIVRFGQRNGRYLQIFVGGSVIIGCAAYEAGNILGAVSGLQLITGYPALMLAVAITVITFFLLWIGSPSWISNTMMFLVGVMGIAFFIVAAMQDFSTIELIRSVVVPRVPEGSQLLVLGLVGTTVVPYNVFLGSGISKGQTIPLMRIGLTISIFIGGFITAAILLAGTAIKEFSSFSALYADFEQQVGTGAAIALALGLFAAGFSSAVTSPYAAAVISRTVFGFTTGWKIKTAWMSVLLIGFLVAISGVKPVPVILLVQALNGLILPFLVIFLILICNDPILIPRQYRHGVLYNFILLLMLGAVVLMSLNNVDKVIISTLHLASDGHLLLVCVLSFAVVAWTASQLFRNSKATHRV